MIEAFINAVTEVEKEGFKEMGKRGFKDKIPDFTKLNDGGVDLRKLYKTELIKILLRAKLAKQEPAEFAKENNIDLTKIVEYYPEIVYNLSNKLTSQLSEILEFPSFMDNIEKNINVDIWSKSIFVELANRIDDNLLDEKLQKELLKSVLDIIVIEQPINKYIIKEQKENIDNNWRLVK